MLIGLSHYSGKEQQNERDKRVTKCNRKNQEANSNHEKVQTCEDTGKEKGITLPVDKTFPFVYLRSKCFITFSIE